MRALTRLLRALLHRPGTTVMILLVSLVATAAAATAPTYYESARTSILRDTLDSAPLIERGFEVTRQGAAAGSLDPLSRGLDAALRAAVPDGAMRARALGAPVDAVETSAFFREFAENLTLAWRTDVCAQLKIVQGSCASSVNQVTISQSLATHNGWSVGQRLSPPGWPTLVVSGIYAVPDFSQPYWFGRGSTYFPAEDATGTALSDVQQVGDAMFTVRDTVDGGAATVQGTVVIDQLINGDDVRAGDLGVLSAAMSSVQGSQQLTILNASLQSGFPGLVSTIHASWRSLAVTEFLIGAQLLVLVWLLMFLLVKDAVEARAADIALVKLRGYKGLRLLGFGLAEPTSLLLAALPLGVALGWIVSLGLARAQLRHGIATGLPALAWAAAGVATIGGLAAVSVAGRRALRRPVADQWRRTQRGATDRGWVVDAMVLTAAVAGLAELRVSGQITSVGHGSLGLLEPGLLGLAVAVVASRLLPMLCRRAFGATGRRGSLGIFLAVRHVARRSGGARTMIILATAFALATFGIASWSTGRANRALAASVSVGAPTAFTVNPPAATDVGAIVDAIDPGGTQAVVVDSYYNGGTELLAVDPARFAHVAAWRGRFSSESLSSLMAKLQPATAPSIVLDGDQFRIRLDVEALSPPGEVVEADVGSRGSLPVQVELGSIDQASGSVVLTGRLVGCPCQLRDLVLSQPVTPGLGGGSAVKGALVINGIDVHRNDVWTPLAGVTKPSQWNTNLAGGGDALTPVSAGLRWSFAFSAVDTATLSVADFPAPLPALVSSSVAAGSGGNPIQTNGLDGQALQVMAIGSATSIPGSTTTAVVVDRGFAERASGGYLSALATQQVWTTASAALRVEAGLRKAGISIAAVSSAGATTRLLDRQGPGLASVAFLANALAAAVLAAAATIMGLVTAGRRRRYEYAALAAAGASRRTLFTGLLVEQSGVLLFGAATGIVAGLISAAVALRGVPEFVVTPTALSLSYVPNYGVLGAALAAAIGVLLVVAFVSSAVLVGGVRSDQLREAPS